MGKTLFKKLLTLLFVILSSTSMADNLQIYIGDKLIVPTSDLYIYKISEKE